jgi:hypothetical protein
MDLIRVLMLPHLEVDIDASVENGKPSAHSLRINPESRPINATAVWEAESLHRGD